MRVVNNTIMKNITTATAVTSNGQPAPAGLSTSANSDQLQATLPGGSPTFSNPLLFNNIFWDNRAGTRAGTTVDRHRARRRRRPRSTTGTSASSTAPGLLSPTNSVIQQDAGEHPYTDEPDQQRGRPRRSSTPYDVSVSFATWRQNPAFVDADAGRGRGPAGPAG